LHRESTEITRNPFEEDETDGKKKADEQIVERKGESEAECADCDAFRSGAALTISLFFQFPSTSRSARSLTCFCPHCIFLFPHPSLIRTPSTSEENWQGKAGNELFPNVDQEDFLEEER